MDKLPGTIQSWRASGKIFRFEGLDLFYKVDGNAPGNRPWLVCFHGFPTSSWDWHRVLPLLAQDRPVLVFDFPGYGLSSKPTRRDYALGKQLEAALALLNHLEIRSFDLLSHDMGNSVACELLRRVEQGRPELKPLSLTLLNGGIYMDLHRPLLTQRLLRTPMLGAVTARFSSYRVFRHQYPAVYAEPGKFDEDHYRAQWALLQHNGGRHVLHRLAGYMKERTRMGEQWTGPLERYDGPLEVIWGLEDRIALPAIADRLQRRHGNLQLETLSGVGHYPQLEAPRRICELLSSQ